MSSAPDYRPTAMGVAHRTSALRWAARILVALVPIATLGLLSWVPSLVLAVQRRRRAEWTAFLSFGLVWLLWIADLSISHDIGSGVRFALNVLLMAAGMGGAAMHYLLISSRQASGPSGTH